MSTLQVLGSDIRQVGAASRPSLGDCVRELADSLVDLSWMDSHEIDREVETVLGNPPAPRMHRNIQPNDTNSDDSDSNLSTDSESDSEDDTLHSSWGSEDQDCTIVSPPSLFEDEETSSEGGEDCEDSTPSKVCETTEVPVAEAHCLGAVMMRRQARSSSPKLHSTSFDDASDDIDDASSSSNFDNVYSISWLFGEDEHEDNRHTTPEQRDEDIYDVSSLFPDDPTIPSPKSSVPRVGFLSSETGKVSLQLKIDVRSLEALTLVEDSVKVGEQRFGRKKPWHRRAWKQLKKLFTCCVTPSED